MDSFAQQWREFGGESAAFTAIAPDERHIWRLDPDCSQEQFQRLFALLSVQEQERARRFRFDADRRRFVTARAHLRTVLAQLRQCDPQSVEFEIDALGKPHLAGASGVEFSISHSGAVVLLAIAGHGNIGVDVEHVREVLDIQAMAELMFDEPALEALRQAQPSLRCRTFFREWVRLEALAKADGVGLPGIVDANAKKTRAELSRSYAHQLFDVSTDYFGAVAFHPSVKRSVFWNWSAASSALQR